MIAIFHLVPGNKEQKIGEAKDDLVRRLMRLGDNNISKSERMYSLLSCLDGERNNPHQPFFCYTMKPIKSLVSRKIDLMKYLMDTRKKNRKVTYSYNYYGNKE